MNKCHLYTVKYSKTRDWAWGGLGKPQSSPRWQTFSNKTTLATPSQTAHQLAAKHVNTCTHGGHSRSGCHICIECAPKQFKFLQKGFCSQNFLSIIPYLRELRMIDFQFINSLAITGCIFHSEHTLSPVCLLCHWMTCLLEYC